VSSVGPLAKANYFSSKKLSFGVRFHILHHHGRSIQSGRIIKATIAAGMSAQPQIDKMVEQICLLSKEVIRLRGQLTIHPQPAHDVRTHVLEPQPQRTPVAWRRLSYAEGYAQNEEEPPRCCSRSPTRECSHHPTVAMRSEHSCKIQTSHRGREESHHSCCSMLNSSSSSGSHWERPRRKAEENSRHHQLAHQY